MSKGSVTFSINNAQPKMMPQMMPKLGTALVSHISWHVTIILLQNN